MMRGYQIGTYWISEKWRDPISAGEGREIEIGDGKLRWKRRFVVGLGRKVVVIRWLLLRLPGSLYIFRVVNCV